MQRPRKNLSQREAVLIITNGEQEENYFKSLTRSFRSIYKIEVVRQKQNISKMVEFAISGKAEREYNMVWCVFDIDEQFKEGHLTQDVVALARKNGISLAYSNEAFEVWLMFHFEESVKRIKRTQYDKEMTRLIKKHTGKDIQDYKSAKTDVELLRKHFVPKAREAATRAKISYQRRVLEHEGLSGRKGCFPFWLWTSTTNVFNLVERLMLTEKFECEDARE